MLSAEFNKPQGPYFLSHSVGLLPLSARARLEQSFVAPWAAGDGEIWDFWLAAIDGFQRALAPVIGARAEDICPQTNISSALTKVLFSLPVVDGRTKIVLTEDDFPTVGFVAAQAERLGLEPVFLKGGARLADPDAWAPGFADDVHLLHVTHVFSNLGLKAPVADIVARAKAKGVITVVDVAQSAGAVDVAAVDWGADFVTGTSVKYLCGGPGACFLWVNPEIAPRTAPADVGWFSHENPFEFDIRRFAYAPGAKRFWGGTPSVAPYAVAAAGADLIAKEGVAAISAHNQKLIDRMIAALPEDAFLSHIKEGERGCSFIVRPRRLEEAVAALRDAGVIHDRRQGALRFSVHLYTDDKDVERLTSALSTFL